MAFGAAYVGCVEIGHALSPPGVPFATFWPASGLYFAMLLLAARRRWRFVVAAAAANVLSETLLHGRPAGVAFAFSLSNTAEALAAAYAAARFAGRDPAGLCGLFGVLRLSAAGLIGTAAGATCGALVVVSLLGGEPSPKAWMTWWIADMVGVLAVAPVLLSWSRFNLFDPPTRPTLSRLGEAALVGVAIGAAAAIGGAAIPGLPGLWLIFAYPPLVWTAVRFGARGTSLTWLAVLLLAVGFALAAARTSPGVLPIETRLTALQLAAVFIGFTVSTLAAVSDEQKAASAALRREVEHRRRAEEALRKSEERFELAVEGASDGIWDWDLRTGGVYFSARFKELLGYSDAEFPNTLDSWHFRLHPDDRQAVSAAIGRHLSTGARYDEVYRLRTKSGEYRWVEARGRAVCDAAGRPVRMVGALADLTERRRADERFRVLFDCSTDAHLIFDGSGIIDCNKAAVEMLGCRDKREVLSLHPAELSPEFQPDGRRSLEKCVEMDALAYENGFHRFEWVHRRMNGQEFPVEVTLNPVELAGRPALLVVWHDISERKRHERELMAERALLRQFIARTPAAIAIVDRDMRYIQVSDRWLTDYRLGEMDVIGRSHYKVFPDLPERWKEVHKRALAGAVERCDDDSYLRADGTLDWLQWEVRPWRRADGEIGGLIFFTQVITARKRIELDLRRHARDMEAAYARIEEQAAVLHAQAGQLIAARERAEAASRAKSEFLANMSHEIRTPMNGVLGMLELALETPLTADQRELVGTARRSAESLLEVINDLLDFSKIEAGRMELEAVPFSVRRLVEEAVRLFDGRARAKGISLTAWFDPATPAAAVGDPARVRQVLVNLIGNAVKFTETGGVRVSVDPAGAAEDGSPRVAFSVTDTGIGIPSEKQWEIFAAFAQADTSVSRRFGGTGLGLSISGNLARLMGGAIEVESEPGLGSTFRFVAPLRPADDLRLTEPAAVRSAAPPSRPLDVLLAEDNAVNSAFAMRVLEGRGHRVARARDGREAVAAAGGGRFDVILMDVQMPEMDGIEAARRIREAEVGANRRISIVAMTAHASAEDRDRCLAAGMDDYVSKPVSAAELIRRTEGRCGPPAAAGAGPPAEPDRPSPDRLRWDRDAAMRVVGDEALFRELVGVCLEDAPKQIAAIREACERRDANGVRLAAHTLKGAAGLIGATEVRDAALRIERAAAGADFGDIERVLRDVEAGYFGVLPEMQALTAGGAGN